MSDMQQALFGTPQTVSTSDDFYTPPWVFERMGIEFELDVASPPGGVEWIPAARFYTVEDDGLNQPWTGRVWMNPPYSRPTPWVDRFIAHSNGIALLPFAKSAWFDRIWTEADAIVAPGVHASKFVGGPIFMPVFLAAFTPECVAAIARVGTVRRHADPAA